MQSDEALGFDLQELQLELAPVDAIHRACSAVAGVLAEGEQHSSDAEQAVGRLFSTPTRMR